MCRTGVENEIEKGENLHTLTYANSRPANMFFAASPLNLRMLRGSYRQVVSTRGIQTSRLSQFQPTNHLIGTTYAMSFQTLVSTESGQTQNLCFFKNNFRVFIDAASKHIMNSGW